MYSFCFDYFLLHVDNMVLFIFLSCLSIPYLLFSLLSNNITLNYHFSLSTAAAGWPLSELWHKEIASVIGLDSILVGTYVISSEMMPHYLIYFFIIL